jgi:hypothetical protein
VAVWSEIKKRRMDKKAPGDPPRAFICPEVVGKCGRKTRAHHGDFEWVSRFRLSLCYRAEVYIIAMPCTHFAAAATVPTCVSDHTVRPCCLISNQDIRPLSVELHGRRPTQPSLQSVVTLGKP